eukprot:6202417-Pleurochrysis_carterae.AAC.2
MQDCGAFVDLGSLLSCHLSSSCNTQALFNDLVCSGRAKVGALSNAEVLSETMAWPSYQANSARGAN